MTSWWPPTLRAEVRDLTGQVDSLAVDRDEVIEDRDRLATLLDATESVRDELQAERDDLAEQLKRMTQSRDDTKRWLRAAYEPTRVGECGKMRYVHRHDAERHIIDMVAVAAGESMNAYECRRCPEHPGYRTKWWHAGHCRPGDVGAIELRRDRTAVYWCGCVFAPRMDQFVWRCREHDESATAREAS